MFARTSSQYRALKSLSVGRSPTGHLAAYGRSLAVFLFVFTMGLIPAPSSSATTAVPNAAPILISQETSTRAIAIDSLSFTSEPFLLTSPYAAGADRRTRIMLFALNLSLQPGEDVSQVAADAEDATHQHYNLAVEYVGPVPHEEWLSAVVLRLNDNLGDVGDSSNTYRQNRWHYQHRYHRSQWKLLFQRATGAQHCSLTGVQRL